MKLRLTLALWALCLGLSAQGIVEHDCSMLFSIAPNIPVASSNSNLSATPITRGAGLTAVTSITAFSSTQWPAGNVAPTGNDFLTFTLNANSGFIIDVRSAVFSFAVQKSLTTGPSRIQVYTSADNFSSPISTTALVTTAHTNINCTFPNTAAYNNLFSLTVRIYGDQAASGAAVLALKDPTVGPANIQLTGSVNSCVPQLTFISSQPPVCAGSTLNLSATFSSPVSVSYSWAGPNSFTSSSQSPSIPSATGANSGTYTVTATAAGCGSSTASTTYNVSDITSPISSTNETCPGTCDGTAQVAPSGGIGQYSFSWAPAGGSAASAANLCAGTYTCTISDGIGCTASRTVSVVPNNCSNSTQLTPTWCGATNCNLSQTIAANTVSGATNYEFRFVNTTLGYSYSRVKGNGIPTMPLSWILGLQYGQTYQVQVRAFVNNTWGNFGSVCSLSMSNTIPTTQLTTASCGASGLTLSSTIFCNAVAGAQNYEFRITNSQMPYNYTRQRGSGTANIPLSWFPGMQYGRTYNVEVRANVGGTWGSFGNVCTITLQSSIPSPTVTTCGGTYSVTSPLSCTSVVAAQDYEWLFVGPQTYVRQRGSNLTSMYPSSITGFAPGTYTVSVKAKVGGVWATSYGPSCTVTITTGARMENPELDAEEVTPISLILYPNPVGQGTAPSIMINGADGKMAILNVFDISGKMVDSYQVAVTGNEFIATLQGSQNLPSGMYFITMDVEGTVQTTKFVVE